MAELHPANCTSNWTCIVQSGLNGARRFRRFREYTSLCNSYQTLPPIYKGDKSNCEQRVTGTSAVSQELHDDDTVVISNIIIVLVILYSDLLYPQPSDTLILLQMVDKWIYLWGWIKLSLPLFLVKGVQNYSLSNKLTIQFIWGFKRFLYWSSFKTVKSERVKTCNLPTSYSLLYIVCKEYNRFTFQCFIWGFEFSVQVNLRNGKVERKSSIMTTTC